MKQAKVFFLKVIFLLSVAIPQTSALGVEGLHSELTKKQIEQGVDGVTSALIQNYIYPEKALLIAKELQRKLATNELDEIRDWYSFIRHINNAMRSVSGDTYLDIVETKSPIVLRKVQESVLGNRPNQGIDSGEILFGNVGYVKFNYFEQSPDAEQAIIRTLATLSKVDALIIDLRYTEGDSIFFAQLLMSFFVESNMDLGEFIFDQQRNIMTLKALEGIGLEKFRNDFPIYILTSSFLEKAGEYFSYTLKRLKKTIIVGEETMGVAYILKKQEINSHISLNIPIAMPKSNMNWEQSGVTPDVYIEADLALEAAHKLAKAYLGVF
jgi:hypothetical protein